MLPKMLIVLDLSCDYIEDILTSVKFSLEKSRDLFAVIGKDPHAVLQTKEPHLLK